MILAAGVDTRIAIVVVGASVALGVALGVVSGYFGGLIDEAVMRITDVFLSIPALILALAVAAALSFIGIGAGPETAEWGAMIARGFDNLISGYWGR